MATKKKLLQAAAGSASGGAGALNVEQVFSTYLYDGNGSSQVIENGINLGQSNDGGSISLDAQEDGLEITQSSDFNFGTGDFTCEAWVWLNDSNTTYRTMFGFDVTGGLLFQVWNMQLDLGLRGTSSTVSNGSLSANQWNHLAVVRSSGTVYLFLNGTLDKTATVDGASNSWSTINLSNSSNALIGDYSKSATNFNGRISNLRVSNTARYTATFTVPTSALSSDANTVLLIGQNDDPFTDQSSSSHSAIPYGSPSKSGFGPFDAADAGEGGLVWTKSRSGTQNHWLYTTATSGTKGLISNDTATITNYPTYNELSSYNANGFTLGTASNGNQSNLSGETYASWTFRKAPKFFDVVTYTGTGVARTVSHNLGSVPGMIIIKRTDSATSWNVYHSGLNGGTNPHQYGINLNTTGAEFASSGYWNNTAPTSTEFTVGTSANANASGGTYVAYLFAHNNGDGDFGPTGDQDIIKCGSYTGTGAAGNFVDLGFEPQWVLIKNASQSYSYTAWNIFDNMRGVTTSGTDALLMANSSATEGSDPNNPSPYSYIDFNSTGFTPAASVNQTNGSGDTYIYIAIRRGPMAVPTAATDVFAIDQGINSSVGDRVFNAGFPVDLLIRTDPTTAYNRLTIDRLRGNGKFIAPNLTDAEADTAYGGELDDMQGVFTDTSFDFSSHYAYMWQRRPNYFDIVAYTGNGTAGRTVSHNLGVAPEMMWVKRRDGVSSWITYWEPLGATKGVFIDTNAAFTSDTYWNDTAPTDSVFTLGNGSTNTSSATFIAYLFASLDGVSKVGSYTGTGSQIDIDCGFSNGARFVLIKRYDTSGHSWLVYDSVRGIVSGNDPYLKLDTTDVEVTGTDLIDPYSAGFTIPSGTYFTTSGASYIFYAIA